MPPAVASPPATWVPWAPIGTDLNVGLRSIRTGIVEVTSEYDINLRLGQETTKGSSCATLILPVVTEYQLAGGPQGVPTHCGGELV